MCNIYKITLCLHEIYVLLSSQENFQLFLILLDNTVVHKLQLKHQQPTSFNYNSTALLVHAQAVAV